MTQFVRVISRDPFQVTMFKAKEGEADLLAHRLRQVLMQADGNYETDTLTQEEIDAMMLERIDTRVNQTPTNPDDIPPLVA